MKKACVFFKRLRLTYPILIGVAVAQLFKEFDLVLFALDLSNFNRSSSSAVI